MIRKTTTLVLGAGASCPYGFPTASGLRDLICSLQRDYRISNPGYSEDGYMYPLDRSFELGNLERFQADFAASRLASIDAFLSHVYTENPKYVDIGRAAIAAALIPLEQPDALSPSPETDWYSHLINVMGRDYAELSQSAEKLKVITFNYDRSLEYYLFNAFVAMHGKASAVSLLKSIDIVHVYGQLGQPDFLDPAGRAYLPKRDHHIVSKCASEIKVIPDNMAVSVEFERAHSFIAAADHLCFIGFGFDELNVQRLNAADCFGGKCVLITAYHMSGTQRSAAEGSFDRKVTLGLYEQDALRFLQDHNVFGHVPSRTGR